MEIVSNIALISINETMIVQLVSFLIFLFIINRVMFRPLRGVMGEREQFVEGIKSEISDAESEMEKINSLLKKQESATRQQAFDMRKELEDAGSQQASVIFAAARKEVMDLKERTEEEIEVQISEARKKLKEESEALALRIMEKILERRIPHETHP